MIHDLTAPQLDAVRESLAAGSTIAQALRGACGGSLPAWAWASLGRERARDEALRALCVAADARVRDGGRPKAARREEAQDVDDVDREVRRVRQGEGQRPGMAVGATLRRPGGHAAGRVLGVVHGEGTANARDRNRGDSEADDARRDEADRDRLRGTESVAQEGGSDDGAEQGDAAGRAQDERAGGGDAVRGQDGGAAADADDDGRSGGGGRGREEGTAETAGEGAAPRGGGGAVAAVAAWPGLAAVSSKRASEATDDGAPDWQRIREEAAELAPGPMGWVLYQEARLAAADKGFPALSPFSLYTIDRFFLSGKRWFLWMAGRGFGKSTLTSRLAVAIGYGIQRRAAPGPAWVCPLVSVLPVDAERRLEDILAILIYCYRQIDTKIALGKSLIAGKDPSGNPIAWISSASTIGNVSGPSSFAALVDEEEKILYGRAGGIVGSLAFTFRSRPRVYGMRVSSSMTGDDTLARACKLAADGAHLTNFVATLGPYLADAIAGLLAVAAWEEARGNAEAGAAIRAHAATLTPDSWQIPTWLGHPSIGRPADEAGAPLDMPWTAADAAVATRIEAEAVDKKNLDGLDPWRYWLRECASVPTSADEAGAWDGGEALGIESRYAAELGDRDYGDGAERGYG
jgi:hypothetical protein